LIVSICFSGRVKAKSLLFSSGWQHYRWLDSFRESLKRSFDFRTFQAKINWDLIENLLYCLKKSETENLGLGKPPAGQAADFTDAPL
jgi:hypothetical protein